MSDDLFKQTDLADDIDGLDAIYDYGMRVLQLTYNLQNKIGLGSYEK